MKNIVSFSGGKDSTAMLLKMIEKKEPIHSIVFFDTEWDFPQMYDHIEKVEKNIGMKIWRVRHRVGFDYLLHSRPVIYKAGENKGQLRHIGHGWPSMQRRWCTREKLNSVNYFTKPILDGIQCVGIAADEIERNDKLSEEKPRRFPLQEYGMTEIDCLQYCFDMGYDWGGLYNHFDRVSCFCCPLMKKRDLETIYKYYPDIWKRMVDMGNKIPDPTRRAFRNNKTLEELSTDFC